MCGKWRVRTRTRCSSSWPCILSIQDIFAPPWGNPERNSHPLRPTVAIMGLYPDVSALYVVAFFAVGDPLAAIKCFECQSPD
jgi:hypothetical protein